jgi:hypothetical protein
VSVLCDTIIRGITAYTKTPEGRMRPWSKQCQRECYGAVILFLSLSFWLRLVFYTTFIWTLKALRVFHQSVRKLKRRFFDKGRFNDQCFYVFIVTPDDGVTEHRNMSG